MITRTGSLFRRRWPLLVGAAIVLAIALTVGSVLSPGEQQRPIDEVAAAQIQPDLTDPGLHANRPVPSGSVVEPQQPEPITAPEASLPQPPVDGPDPGTDQVVPESSGALAAWLADRPANMGSFSTQDAITATDLDVSWMLYQGVENGTMTQGEADTFQAWFDRRPTADEAPELLNYVLPDIQRPGQEPLTGSDIGAIKSR